MYFLSYMSFLFLIPSYNVVVGESLVASIFKKNEQVSKVVQKPPQEVIYITYSGKKIYPGTTVQPLETLTEPEVDYNAQKNALYTLIFLGPDLPPSIAAPVTEFLHWLVVNIPGNVTNKGHQIATYFPPVPYPGGFPYIFLLYQQNGILNTNQIPDRSSLLSRPKFSLDAFVNTYNLEGPIAGNFLIEVYSIIVSEAIQELYKTVGKVLGPVAGLNITNFIPSIL